MTRFAAYFDDSGSEGLGPVFVLAAYVAPIESWERFTVDWKRVLGEKPPIPYLKMKHANSLREAFWGWAPRDRDSKVDRLADVIEEHVSWGVTCTLFWEDFRKIKGEAPDLPLVPYDFLFHGAMATTANFLIQNGHKEDKIDFIFDSQGGAGVRAAAGHRSIRQFLTPSEQSIIAREPIHCDEMTVLPLQAADLIAWQTRRFVYENRENLDPPYVDEFPVNSAVLRRLENIPTVYKTYGLDRLRGIIQDYQALKELKLDPGAFLEEVRKPSRPWLKAP